MKIHILTITTMLVFSCAGKKQEASKDETGAVNPVEQTGDAEAAAVSGKPKITRDGMKAVKQVREKFLDAEKKPAGDLRKVAPSQIKGGQEAQGAQKYSFTSPEIPKIAKTEWPPFNGKKVAFIHTSNVMGELEPCG
ncbi:MAG: hypothetical protein FJ088_03075 [Deltaproteobacteria bacterium]|nr:hypothetical protein [Deltaproteobacteria bacterium]